MAAGDLANVGKRSPTGAQHEPTSGTDRSSSGLSIPVGAAALTLTVALGAIAFATVLRPRHGYRRADSLLLALALALAIGAALGAVAIVGAIAAFRRRHESVWEAMTGASDARSRAGGVRRSRRWLQIVPALGGPAGRTTSTPAARADFQRWQATVVPIVVGWMHAIRADRAFTHTIPALAVGALRGSVDRSRGRSTGSHALSQPSRPAYHDVLSCDD